MIRFAAACLATVVVFIIFCNPILAEAQINERLIVLKALDSPFHPKEYFIKRIVDNRKNKGGIGSIIISQDLSQVKQSVDLKEGLQSALKKYIAQSAPGNTSLRPIIFNVQELKISETNQSAGLVKGSVQLSVIFELERNNEPVKLIEYKGGSQYTRSVKQVQGIELMITKTISQAIQYCDIWINREENTNVLLAENVLIKFTDQQKVTQDTLFYNSQRQLSWADFKGKPVTSSRFAAEIFPFFSFEESSTIKKSVIHVDIKLKVYLIKSFSWVKDYARHAYTLNHEQRHFDLVKITAEKFKNKIQSERLSGDNYQGILSVEYLESLREMHRLQVQYDTETQNGINDAAQSEWNSRIDKELNAFKELNAN